MFVGLKKSDRSPWQKQCPEASPERKTAAAPPPHTRRIKHIYGRQSEQRATSVRFKAVAAEAYETILLEKTIGSPEFRVKSNSKGSPNPTNTREGGCWQDLFLPHFFFKYISETRNEFGQVTRVYSTTTNKMPTRTNSNTEGQSK